MTTQIVLVVSIIMVSKLYTFLFQINYYLIFKINFVNNIQILQAKEAFLTIFNRFVGNEIPEVLIKILTATGFDTKCALDLLTEKSIAEIEGYVNANRATIANTTYEKKLNFKFLPGHRSILLSFPKKIQSFNEKSNEISYCDSSDFSFILKSLIETVESNAGKHPKAVRYNEVVKYFSLYIYLHCGRACYETLSANLPIPKANTICEFIAFLICSSLFI